MERHAHCSYETSHRAGKVGYAARLLHGTCPVTMPESREAASMTTRRLWAPRGHTRALSQALSDVRPMPHSGGLSALLAANYLKVLELLTNVSKGTVNDDD